MASSSASRAPEDARATRTRCAWGDRRMVTYTAATGSSDAGKLDRLRVTGARTTVPRP
ncbi:hypothetical protein [Streptomyces violaceusniger]|uniref:hypothetical protein n=1 Tax=Streptomyces violaceusniger TaxID=68280 RepID=UPI001AD84B48|nr:hypothetical protein [Streptomyces violaceusniger]